jgi:hypothetical protein
MICKVAQGGNSSLRRLRRQRLADCRIFWALLIAMNQGSTESRFFVSIQVANLGPTIDLRLATPGR